MYCSKCGKEITDSSEFCQYCGQKVNSESYQDSNVNTSGVKIKKLSQNEKKGVGCSVLIICIIKYILYYCK